MKKVFIFGSVVFCFAIAFRGFAADNQPEKIRVAISSISTSQVNVWVPLDTGFFKRQGLDVELVYISGSYVRGGLSLMWKNKFRRKNGSK